MDNNLIQTLQELISQIEILSVDNADLTKEIARLKQKIDKMEQKLEDIDRYIKNRL